MKVTCFWKQFLGDIHDRNLAKTIHEWSANIFQFYDYPYNYHYDQTHVFLPLFHQC